MAKGVLEAIFRGHLETEHSNLYYDGVHSMNYLLLPTLLIAGVLFVVGMKLDRRANLRAFWMLSFVGILLSAPGILFAVYYLKILGNPIWFYQFRSVPFSELSAGGAGFLAGLLHGRFSKSDRFRKVAGSRFFPGALALGLLIPYLKPIVRPPDWKLFQDKWSAGVCLQTSESSCGPACAASLLRLLGKKATEEEIARASFTSRNGTENWFLARTLRARGCTVQFIFEPDASKPWPYPAIAGVRLPASGNSGHFITVLDRVGNNYVIGDPLGGKSVGSQTELRGDYDFTGFFMVVK